MSLITHRTYYAPHFPSTQRIGGYQPQIENKVGYGLALGACKLGAVIAAVVEAVKNAFTLTVGNFCILLNNGASLATGKMGRVWSRLHPAALAVASSSDAAQSSASPIRKSWADVVAIFSMIE